MKKASKICLLIGGILGLVLTLLWLTLSIVWFVRMGMFAAAQAGDGGANWSESFQRWFTDWIYAHGYGTWEEVIAAAAAEGVKYLIFMLFALPCAILSFILRGKEKTGLPLPIVVAVLAWSGNVASFVGAGLAIANWAVVERKEGQSAEEKKEEKPAEEPKEEEKAE